MKRINNEQILDTLYDLADGLGLRIDEFLMRVEEEFGEQPIDTEGLPAEVIEELERGRSYKLFKNRAEREKRASDEMNAEIKRFRESFPDVDSDSIPESVWADVQAGIPLAYAYALYSVTLDGINKIASRVNRRNGDLEARAVSNGSTEPSFTKEQVEKMSGKEVKSNYKSILKAMKNWRV